MIRKTVYKHILIPHLCELFHIWRNRQEKVKQAQSLTAEYLTTRLEDAPAQCKLANEALFVAQQQLLAVPRSDRGGLGKN